MNRTLLSFAVAALVLAAGAANSAKYSATKSSSAIIIKGTSTLHDWSMSGHTINGSIAIDPEIMNSTSPETWKGVVVSTSIPVASIKSEHAKMDALMCDALKAGTNPEIRYELT